ncbi:MAG: M20/M25/M40 family metallo-hydrolase [Pseudomonadota bacterium]
MNARETLLEMIEAEKERILDFLTVFIRHPTPNPPGETVAAAGFITDFLEREGVPWRVVAPEPTMPNIIGTLETGRPGRHLVLNGHIDVFPVGEVPEEEGWTTDPWGAERRDGAIYGRGAADMKAGTSASIWTYVLLSRLMGDLKGRLTLTCVSDEETFGPWGARWLMANEPEVRGDCCLNGEPSSPYSVRYGEKGPLWLTFTIRTPGGHGAYTHASPSATRLAMRLIQDLETLEDLDFPVPHNLMRAQTGAEGRAATDRAMGEGAADVLPKVTLNIGTIKGGLKNNMIPHTCIFEADIRLPVGVGRAQVMAEVEKIAARHPHARFVEDRCNEPSWCDPHGEMMEIIRETVVSLGRARPVPVVSIGGTDARLWRYEGIPAYVYGPAPTGMGGADEHVEIDEFMHVLRTHVLSAHAYLTA